MSLGMVERMNGSRKEKSVHLRSTPARKSCGRKIYFGAFLDVFSAGDQEMQLNAKKTSTK
jgi:hypothetical protein